MTHFTEEEIKKGDFLFASYKHVDKDIVYSIVDKLILKGVRIWCDKDLVIGDNWNERVAKIIKLDTCRGVLFFNSKDAFISDPIAKERALIKLKLETSSPEQPMLVLPINIGKPSTMRIIKSVFEELPDNDAEINSKIPLTNLNIIIDLFNNDTISCYASPSTIDDCVNSLFNSIEKTLPSALDSSRDIKKIIGDKTQSVSFGKYKGEDATKLLAYHLEEDGLVSFKGEDYIVSESQAYKLVSLKWNCLYRNGEEMVLLCENIIESRLGGADLTKWLNTKFKTYAFTQKELECIMGDVTLLSDQDITKTDNKDFFKVQEVNRVPDKQWWINSFGIGIMQKIIREDGTIYNNGYNSRIKKCGVRPVIRINVTKFQELQNNK